MPPVFFGTIEWVHDDPTVHARVRDGDVDVLDPPVRLVLLAHPAGERPLVAGGEGQSPADIRATTLILGVLCLMAAASLLFALGMMLAT